MSNRDELTGTIHGDGLSGSVNGDRISGTIDNSQSLSGEASVSRAVMYENILHRPYIEGQELKAGDNDYEELGLNRLSNFDILEILTR